MPGLIKWLLNRIKEIDVMDVVEYIWKEILPVEKGIDMFCNWLDWLADKTETQIDDEFVKNLRISLKQLLLGKSINS